tara:strand:- start:2662 stop:3537 length:876 start_codon:yes stop_codon:yes gene_type:complete
MARKITTGEVGGALGGINITNTTISAAENLDITIDPQGSGRTNIQGNTHLGLQADLRFGDSDDSNYVGFKAPATIASDVIWTLPAAEAVSTGYALVTNGAGVLSWQAAGPAHADETGDAATYYPVISTQSATGFLTETKVSTTKLSFQPSTGTMSLGGNTASTSITTGTLVVTGGIGVSGAIYAGADILAYASSDKRLKEDIVKIDNSLEKLTKLSGYEYNWNSIAQEMYPERTKRDVGVIAQEVQEVLPSAVVEREDGYLAISYDSLIPLLIESIKTLKQEIDTIKGGQQ